jgi:hypothetical protein
MSWDENTGCPTFRGFTYPISITFLVHQPVYYIGENNPYQLHQTIVTSPTLILFFGDIHRVN